MVDKFFDRTEFENMRQTIATLKTEYEKVGDEPHGRLQRLDHSAFGEHEDAHSTGQAVTNHLSGVRDSYNTARDRLHAVERALDGVYEAHLDAEKANKNIFTPRD